jgi:molybdopterin-guanine dinucleotide biosynthesis protein A
MTTVGVILAGGRGRRMGGADKAFLTLGGETLLARTIARARPQAGALVINANGEPERYAEFGLPVVPDVIGGFLGPIAGIVSGLEWMRANRPDAKWLASFACDCPFFPLDLVGRLVAQAEREGVSVAVAASGGRHHPVFAVWRADLPVSAEGALREQGLRKMDDFVACFANTRVEFEVGAVDPFFNINTRDDLVRAETMLASRGS